MRITNTISGLTAILLAALITFVAVLTCSPAAERLEEASGLDWLFALRGPRAAPEDVVIIAISNRAAEALSLPLPAHWARTVYAQILNRISESRPDAVVLDVAFRQARSVEEDAALASAIGRPGNVILFKYLKEEQLSLPGGNVEIQEEILPPEVIARQAAAIGTFTLPKYSDQIYRTQLFHELATGLQPCQPVLALTLKYRNEVIALCRKIPGCEMPSGEISIQALALALHSALSTKMNSDEDIWTPTDKMLMRAFSAGSDFVHINYYGRNGSVTTIGVDEIFAASPDQIRQWLDDKVVFVGYAESSPTEQRDSHITTYSRREGVHLSGVEISATVLANLMDQSLLKNPGHWFWLAGTLAGALLGLASVFLRIKTALIWQLIGAGIYFFVASTLFARSAIWMPLTLPLTALLLINLVVFIDRYQRSKKRELMITGALQQYLPQAASRELASSIIGFEQRHSLVFGVCMITDIVGYTRLSESCDPHELHALMNRYYKILVEEVGKQQGMVANIVGDSLLALWVGPQITSDHCDKACVTALNILERLASLNEFCAVVPTRIAVHGGAFSLGNLGAAGHFEYSPVGDVINTTARIEKLNRKLDTRLLVSACIRSNLSARLCERLSITSLGQHEMRNRLAPVELYTLGTTEPTR